MKETRWVTGVRLAEGATSTVTSVPILPIGSFKPSKYSKVDISQAVAEEMVAHFNDRTLKTDVRFDIDHDFREAAAWIRELSIGEFAHPKTGEMLPGIIAEVEWTETGITALSSKQYRYVSAAFGDYKDEENGQTYHNVLKAVALTNDPVMKMLPAVELSDELNDAEQVVLGDVVDEVMDREKGDVAPEHRAAADGVWTATNALERTIREAIAEGLTGEDLEARIMELTADFPQAVTEAMAISVERADNDGAVIEQVEPVDQEDPLEFSEATDLLAMLDELLDGMEDSVKGNKGVREFRTFAKATRAKLASILDRQPKEGVKMGEQEAALKLAEQERDDALRKLAEITAAERQRKVDEVLASLTEKGMDEASRSRLRLVLLSEDSADVVLSEGAEPQEKDDALLSILSEVEFVPTGAVSGSSQEPPADQEEDKALSEAKSAIAKQMHI